MGSASLRLGRYTVLKKLTSDLVIARDGDSYVVVRSNPTERVAVFLEAARLAQKIEHPNAARVLEVGDDGYATEYIHGEDVRTLLEAVVKAKAQIPLQHVLAIVMAAAAGIHGAHETRGADKKLLGVLHRDLSPSNVIVSRDGTVRVIDFEIARALGPKPAYSSPEAQADRPLDRRSDVFNLGILLYELATTSRLFRGDLAAVRDAIATGKVPLPRVRRPDLPNELGMVIMKALTTDPARRFQTAEEMRAVLEQLAQAADLVVPTRSLGDYVKKMCGERPEPWNVPGFERDGSSPGSGSSGSTPTPRGSSMRASWAENSARRGAGGDDRDSAARIQTGPVLKVDPNDATGSRGSRRSLQAAAMAAARKSSQPGGLSNPAMSAMATDWDRTAGAKKAGGGNKLLIPILGVVMVGVIVVIVLFVMGGGKKSTGEGSGSSTSGGVQVAPTIAQDPTTPARPGSAGSAGSAPGSAEVPLGGSSGSAPGSATPTANAGTRTPGTTPRPGSATPTNGGAPGSATDGSSTTPTTPTPGSAVAETTPDAAPATPPPATPDAAVVDSPATPAPVVAELSSITIDGVASAHAAQIAKCDSSQLHGTLAIAFQIDAAGKVTSAQLSSTAGKPTAAVCVLRAVHSWVFPKPPTGAAKGVYSITYP